MKIMKKILLLGDSIRMDYQDYVKQKLLGKAIVYFPNDNGCFVQWQLRYYSDWYRAVMKNVAPDIIHFNSGLWDVLRLSNEEQCFNNLETYINGIDRLIERMIYFSPKAQLIFATTTSVIEPGFSEGPEVAVRNNSDIELYNSEIVKFLKQKWGGISIDDLHRISVNMPMEARSDDVHFDTLLGKQLLGDKVVESINSFL